MRPRCFPKPFLLLAKEGKDSQTGQTRGERAFYGRRGDRRVLKAPPRIEILFKEKRTARRGTASSKLPKV